MLDIESGMNRLKDIRETKGHTLQEVADAVGTTFATVQRWEAGTRNVSLKWLERLAGFYKEPVSNLVASRDKIYKETINIPLQPRMADVIADKPNRKEIVPIYGFSNGSGEAIMLNFDEPIGFAEIHPEQKNLRDGFATRVVGDSMSPRYDPGILVFANAKQQPMSGKGCIVETTDEGSFIKLFVRMTDKEIICKQFNPPKEWKRQRSDIKALHAIVGTAE